jgi:hypothetical protein
MDTIGKLLPGATPTGIRAAIQAKGLPAQKIGKVWYFDGVAVRRWLRHQTGKQIIKRDRQARRSGAQSLPRIDHFAEPSGNGRGRSPRTPAAAQ